MKQKTNAKKQQIKRVCILILFIVPTNTIAAKASIKIIAPSYKYYPKQRKLTKMLDKTA